MKRIIAAGVTLFILSISSIAHGQVYVKPGDTLGKIAKENGMKVNDIISLNPHIANPDRIKPGDYIIIRSRGEKNKDLVDYARSLQEKTVYAYGGQNPPYYTDCSGWVQHIYKKFGVNLPRVSRDQAKTGESIPFKDLQVGDLMFFSTRSDKVITHVAIYMGENLWISNLNEDKDVEIMSTFGPWTQKYFMWGARHEL